MKFDLHNHSLWTLKFIAWVPIENCFSCFLSSYLHIVNLKKRQKRQRIISKVILAKGFCQFKTESKLLDFLFSFVLKCHAYKAIFHFCTKVGCLIVLIWFLSLTSRLLALLVPFLTPKPTSWVFFSIQYFSR